MRDKILLECLKCKDTFIGTTHIDGVSCPRCDGQIKAIGNIEDLKAGTKETERKIKAAIYNGDIKGATERLRLAKGHKEDISYIGGVDSTDGTIHFTATISINHEKIQETIDMALDNIKEELKQSIKESIRIVV